MTVYIPTMSRHDNLRKIVPAWLDLGIPVRLVVEPSEYRDHITFRNDMGWRGAVRVMPVPRANLGIGYARGFCVSHAKTARLRSIIMSDDDMKPDPRSNFQLLLGAAQRHGVLGVGAVRSIHDRFTGGRLSELQKDAQGMILCPGGWGFQLFALNVNMAFSIGNFDSRLHSYGEDGELARQGISRGIPWAVHCQVRCSAIGKRYAPGGISKRFPDGGLSRTEAERKCLAIIHSEWPLYTNRPDQPLRVAWQKMLNEYIPDWRERSAIHGGDWDHGTP